MRILITGINGFIGNNLVSALKGKHLLYGLDIISPYTNGVADTFSWDDLERISEVDMIIHLAGIAHDTSKVFTKKDYFEVNVGLTQRIFDYFLRSEAKKFIFFSSIKAVADWPNDEVLTEETEPCPVSDYGKSKLEAERYINSKTNPDNKKIYILRPCMIHGPGNKGNLNLLFKQVEKGFPWPLGAFENKRSYTSIDNLIFVINQLVENEIASDTFNIADDEPISTNHLIRIIAASRGKKEHIWRFNTQIIKWVARAGDILHLPLNSERLIKLTGSFVISNTKLRKCLCIENMPVAADEGLKKTISSL
jgi:nucleoside-diphosphate-sugar epimerase